MKTRHLLLATAALTALASCTESEFVGENPSPTGAEQGAISFGSGLKAVTRADLTGADAAEKLGNKFVVGGFKHTTETPLVSTVFDNYIVQWTANTAATTTSNTSDWEYVGITAAAPANVTGEQTIKYWDYSASQYDFAAYSVGSGNTAITDDGELSENKIKVTAITKAETYAGPTYTLKGSATDLAECYISDMVTVEKNNYQKEVQLSFRSLGSKLRVAFYETVPGYSVKDVKFYVDDATTPITTGAIESSATLFIPSGTIGFGSAGTYTVTFPTIGKENETKADHNKAHVSFAATANATRNEMKKTFGTLNYGARERNEEVGNFYLARSSNLPTFAGTDSYYATVLPNPNGAVLELRVDYTLVSIDGSGEVIKIHGAKAFVPAIYAKWLPNYAYTYIFKISDNTNGWTNTTGTDPAGLYPITFDAVVADSETNTQSTITTVATPSITTYQKGHDYTKDEYAAGDIYVQVMNGETLATNLNTEDKSKLYTLSGKTSYTEADVMDALNIQASVSSGTITGRNSVVLTPATIDATVTVPGPDGNNITVDAGTAAKFTAEANNTYAYVYDTGTDKADTYYYAAESAGTQPTDWTETGVWYKDHNGESAVANEDWEANKVFYKKYTNLNKVYGVKIIKVAPTPAP